MPSDYLCRMNLLDGNLVSKATKDELAIKVAQLIAEGRKVPHLAAVLVGSNGASETYVASKVKTCHDIGYKSTLIRLEEDIPEHQLLSVIENLNRDPDVDGILVQLPLPKQVSEMVLGLPGFLPATPYGIMLLLEHYKIDTRGMHAVIVGRSNIVGRPMSILLSNNTNPGNCTVTLCHSQTKNLKDICRSADLLVAALGKPEFVTADMVKEGAIVIDVGISRVPDESRKKGYAIKGDVKFDEVAPKCSYITPVPGGVGPMTIAALMKNTYLACMNNN